MYLSIYLHIHICIDIHVCIYLYIYIYIHIPPLERQPEGEVGRPGQSVRLLGLPRLCILRV